MRRRTRLAYDDKDVTAFDAPFLEALLHGLGGAFPVAGVVGAGINIPVLLVLLVRHRVGQNQRNARVLDLAKRRNNRAGVGRPEYDRVRLLSDCLIDLRCLFRRIEVRDLDLDVQAELRRLFLERGLMD
ncbi:hypothetical protein D9M72_431900 [compost metagenome]